jgi:hypothetical protein
LSFEDDREGQRRRKTDSDTKPPIAAAAPAKKKRQPARDVGDALRSVYQRTIDESIPPEMLDLLGKLG